VTGWKVVLGVFVGVAATACGRRPVDVMTMTPVCDTVPSPLTARETPVASVPDVARVAGDSGVVVGVVAQVISGRALPGSSVELLRATGDSARTELVRRTATDAGGGFVLGPVGAGTYALYIRAVGHLPTTQSLVLGGGKVDTVRIQMRYHRCTGY
jgi:hypothetical protein